MTDLPDLFADGDAASGATPDADTPRADTPRTGVLQHAPTEHRGAPESGHPPTDGDATSHAPAPTASLPAADSSAPHPPFPTPQSREHSEPFLYATVPIEPVRTLVEASAGTGKTFAIAGLCLRLVLEGEPLASDASGLPDLRRLLVVTFTRAATEELRGRIRAALRAALAATRGDALAPDAESLLAPFRGGLLDAPEAPDRLQAALDRVDEASISTIHGFCKRTLDTLAFESGTPFGLEFTDDDKPLKRRAGADAWTALVHDQPALATLAVRLGWTPEVLMGWWQKARRYPDTEVRPSAPPLADALAALDTARRALADVWTDEAADDALGALGWKKDAPHHDLPDLSRRVAIFAERTDTVEAVLACSPAEVAKQALGRSKAQKAAIADACEHPAIQACGAVGRAVETLRMALIHRFIHDVDKSLDAIKRRRGVVGNDDLLARLHDALEPGTPTAEGLAREMKARIGVAIVDEFQDTDPIQYGIFRRAFGDADTGGLGAPGTARPVFFVGDPKQSIYAFRGADVHAYLGAQAEAPRRYTLGRNWRTAAPLVDAVNGLFGGADRPFVYDGIPFRPVEGRPAEPALAGDDVPPFVWWTFDSPDGKLLHKGPAREQVTKATVGEIVRLLRRGLTVDGRPLSPRDIAVLTRTNAQAQELQTLLIAAGVPAAVGAAGDIRESREMREVELLLHAAARPHDERAVRAALATEMLGWRAPQLAALDDDEPAAAATRTLFRDAQQDWRRWGALRALSGLLETKEVPARLLSYGDGERRMTNLRHVLEIIHDAERASHRSPEELLHWLAGRGEHALGKDRVEMRLESDDRAVQLTTLHKSKGLEYEIVFVPFAWGLYLKREEALAHVGGKPVLHLDLEAPDFDEVLDAMHAESVAEHLRQAYVALTRARERCYVAWGAVSDAANSSLGYLLLGHGAAEEDVEPTAIISAARKRAGGQISNAHAAASALAAQHDGMTVLPVPTGAPPAPVAPGDAAGDPLGPERVLRGDARERLADLWRPASFSAWVSGLHADGAVSNRPSSDEPDDAGEGVDADAAPRPETGLHAFAAGRGPGIFFHEMLETADLSAPDGERMTERVRLALQRHGLASPRRHRTAIDPAAAVHDVLRAVGAVRLDGVPLREIARRAGVDRQEHDAPATFVPEWRFVLGMDRVAPAALAEVFREHAPHLGDYADALAHLSPDAADGVLTGIVDLKVEHDGRWHILDWKSNRLGPDADAYHSDALAAAMQEHHYVLQYHLYLVGLHRFLRSRLGDEYDYDAHVGGAHYVFLRGLDIPTRPADGDSDSHDDDSSDHAQADGTPGVISDRPPRALIDALDALLSA